MNDLISVIVPIYNVEDYIEKSLRSLFEQSYSNLEFIFVNDATMDRSIQFLEKILLEYPQRNKQVKIIHHEINQGLPSARNTGLKHVNGKYVYHCDSDDWLHPKILEKLHTAIIKDNAEIAFCDFYNVINNESIIYKQVECSSYIDYLKSFFRGYSQASVWNKLFKASLFRDNSIQFPDGLSMLEDMRTVVELFYYAEKIVYVPESLYYYVRSRAGSLSGLNYQKSKLIREDRIKNVSGISSFLKEKNVTEIEVEINLLKLGAKQNLLINADSISVFKEWANIFPESNKYIKYGNLPLHYKIIAKSILKSSWLIPSLWLFIKSKKKSIG